MSSDSHDRSGSHEANQRPADNANDSRNAPDIEEPAAAPAEPSPSPEATMDSASSSQSAARAGGITHADETLAPSAGQPVPPSRGSDETLDSAARREEQRDAASSSDGPSGREHSRGFDATLDSAASQHKSGGFDVTMEVPTGTEATVDRSPVAAPLQETVVTDGSPSASYKDPTIELELAGATGRDTAFSRDGHVVMTDLRSPAGERTHYTVTKLFAEGGLGKVWLAVDNGLNREVVLKEIRTKKEANPDTLKRFVREAQVTGQLEHPNIVPIYEMGWRKDGQPFYTMRFVRGDTLSDILREHHARRKQGIVDPLELPRLLGVFINVCNAMAYAHSRGVIHRDLKPANIAVGEFGEVIVLDWGLAKILGEAEPVGRAAPALTDQADIETTFEGQVMGTPTYMAPEQARGDIHHVDARSDIYALGAILHTLLVGRSPHEGQTTMQLLQRVIEGKVSTPRAQDSSVPKALSAICGRAMSLGADARYQTATELAIDVQRWLADEPVSAYREPWWRRARRWALKHRTACLSTTAAAATLIAVLGAWRWLEQRRVAGVRSTVEARLEEGRAEMADENWAEAANRFSQALAGVGDEPKLRQLKQTLEQLQGQAQQRRQAELDLAQFDQLRDQALFHATLFTGIDVAANLQAAREAAAQALALFPGEAAAEGWRIARQAFYNDQQLQRIREGCYELLLVQADATAYHEADEVLDAARLESALDYLDQAERIELKTRSIYQRRAALLRQLDRPAEAVGQEKLAAETPLATPLDYFLAGDSLYRAGDVPGAVEHFGEALRREPTHFWAHYFLSVCLLKQNRPGEAIAHLTASLSRRADFGWIYLLRGYAYSELGDNAAAEDDFAKAAQLGVEDYGFFVNRAVVRIRQDKLDEAAADLQQAIQLKPDQYQAYVNLAEVRRRQGQLDDALQLASRALELEPRTDKPYRIRADIRLARQELQQAVNDLAQAIRFGVAGSGSLASDHINRGKLLHQLHRYDEALREYAAAEAGAEEHPELPYLRANALMALERRDEAVAELNRYLDSPAIESQALRMRGFERALRGDAAGAVADFSRSLEMAPNDAAVRARRGWAQLTSSAQIALDDFEQALQVEPDNADLYNGRGYARVQLGQYREAVQDAEKAVQLGAASGQLREWLGLLHNAACIYAQAAQRASLDAAAQDHQKLAEDFEQRAAALLTQAVQMLPPASQGPFLQQSAADAAFDPVRQGEAFRALMQRAAENTGETHSSRGTP